MNIKTQASKELNKADQSYKNFSPYYTINNIVELGILIKMYRNVYSGHKKSAVTYYDKLSAVSKKVLPVWVGDYFGESARKEPKTYDEWKNLGRYVCKGEKSIGRNSNRECVFSLEQTEQYESNPGNYFRSYGCTDCGDDPYYDEDDYDADEIFGTYFDQC